MNIASLLISGGLGGVISWWLTKHYYIKSSKELEENLDEVTRKLSSQETLEEFERLLEQSEWEVDHQGMEPVYVCRAKPTFQFDMKGEGDDFYEDWMKVFPDKNGKVFDLNLKINGITVKTIRFISADGGKYTLPLPEVYLVDDEQAFVWRKNTLGYKVAAVIGNFYRCGSLEEVGRFTGVDVYTDQRH